MERFNLSRWGLQRPQLMAFLILVVACAGAFAYARLGRAEDPSFTIKNAVVTAQWPGATSEEMQDQVADRIEKKLEELDALDYTKSVTVAGQTNVFVNLLPKTRSGKLLRRALQAVAEGRDPGDLTTLDDPTALQQVRDLISGKTPA